MDIDTVVWNRWHVRLSLKTPLGLYLQPLGVAATSSHPPPVSWTSARSFTSNLENTLWATLIQPYPHWTQFETAELQMYRWSTWSESLELHFSWSRYKPLGVLVMNICVQLYVSNEAYSAWHVVWACSKRLRTSTNGFPGSHVQFTVGKRE